MPTLGQVRVDRRLVRADAVAVGPVRHGHDVDVVEFRAALAPVAMGEDVVPADLAARLDLAARRHRPVEQRIEARDALAGPGGLHVLEEGREAADDLALVEALGDLEKDRQRQVGLARAVLPQVHAQLPRLELALERHQHAPFEVGELHAAHGVHRGGFGGARARLQRTAPRMAHAERKDALRGHQPVTPRADLRREVIGVLRHRVAVRHLQRGPEPVLRAAGRRVGRADHHVAGKRIALEHEVERLVEPLRLDFPRHQRARREVGGHQRLPHAADGPGAQHRRDAVDHHVDRQAALPRDLAQRIAHEARDAVLRHREDAGVDLVGMADRGGHARQPTGSPAPLKG